MGKYRIRFKSRAVEKAWYSLEESLPEAMAECIDFLENSPSNRLTSHGKLKKLKGKLRGILQYDVTYSDRVRYQVDNESNTVDIEYIGDPH